MTDYHYQHITIILSDFVIVQFLNIVTLDFSYWKNGKSNKGNILFYIAHIYRRII